jgi:hypothetical protein
LTNFAGAQLLLIKYAKNKWLHFSAGVNYALLAYFIMPIVVLSGLVEAKNHLVRHFGDKDIFKEGRQK